jgi:hypothetical protein
MKVKTITHRHALEALRKGACLMLMHDNAAPDGKSWCIVPGGRITPNIAQRIIARGDVISSEDGLLPGHPQTYKMLAFIK